MSLRRARRAVLIAIGCAALASLGVAAQAIDEGALVRVSRADGISSAALLVTQGKAREAAGDELTALKRYGDALALDPACEDAYLALGGLRAKRGEALEAEQVYSTGLLHLPHSIPLVVARAKVRRVLGKLGGAADDLSTAIASLSPGAPGALATERGILRELASLKRQQGEPAAELAVWRRLLAIAHAEGDAAVVKEASIQARALSLFVGDVDPALGGRFEHEEIRRALAAIARRQ
jgi:tetratricopeptide (TPR) repeat protein